MSHLPELEIEVLGGPAETIEGLVGGDVLAFDQDALRLAYHLSGSQGRMKVGGPEFLVLVALSGGEGEGGEGGEQQPSSSVDNPEGSGIAGVEVEGSKGAVGEEWERQQAANTGRCRLGSESGPPGIVNEVLGLEGDILGDGVEARPFAAAVLERVEVSDHRVCGHRSDEGAAVE